MKIPWGRVLVFGFTFEVLTIFFLAFINPRWIRYPVSDLELTIGLFIGTAIVALWLGKKLTSHQVLTGVLFGLCTILVYVIITVSAELAGAIQINYDLSYFVKHIVKIAGGALGGFVAFNLSTCSTTTEALQD
jgi:putative membrane protein (TIGR04086 family)